MPRNTLKLELKGFEELVTKLEGLNGDVQKVVTDALEQMAETVEWDTKDAVKAANLPAHGRYSTGDTERSIVEGARVEWKGTVAEIGVGFDYGVKGAGGYLITGTPRMKPDNALNRIYKQRKYATKLTNEMKEIVEDAIVEAMEGRP